jgi:HK97 family phage prohead protease
LSTNTLYRTATLSAGTGRTIYGTAVPYGQNVDIRDGYGEYTERFEQGAFKRTIAERGHKVRLFTQHDKRRLPIGTATVLREDPAGLYAEFEVAATRDGDDALELVRSGVIDSFSIGFAPVREHRDNTGVVVRDEVKLHEVSLVSDPAYEGAKVAGVRSEQPFITNSTAAARLRLLDF